MKYPWQDPIFKDWEIISMFHVINGVSKNLHVVMKKGDRIITEYGNDDGYLWNRLWHKAWNISEEENHVQ